MKDKTRMSPRERVLTALAHREPDRVPFSWGYGATSEMHAVIEAYLRGMNIDWALLCSEVNDLIVIDPPYVGPEPPQNTDIWGIRRKSMDYGTGAYDEIEYYPLAGIRKKADLDSYTWPDPALYDYENERARFLDTPDAGHKASQFFGGQPFEIYSWMTGLEESMINLVAQPEVVVRALEHITGFFEEKLRRTLTLCGDLVDLVFLADDLGSQAGLLISRRMYRDILQPFHRRLAGLAKELAPQVQVMFHSDGAVFDMLPDIIDAGIDMLEAVQTDAQGMEPERLKRAYGDRLSFHGAISVQQLLPHHIRRQSHQLTL